ncbi:putative type I restriction enzyme HindVIIP specificity protein [Haemophilus influenzae]|uniref:restriction endonuclease subunit S n=1 Tax=Haemophilus influenzae TaxID=727 RepID=UPI000DA384C1|nr:restriction endonuclease subunit S [Haemophilus influenzae]SQG36946.1 putative type I restriction enzyme HindVIIP specificity protein [Haemophilus influenzae]
MNDWKVITLADCASFQEGYVNPSKNEPSYFGGTIKWLRATDLNNGFVYKTSQTLTEKGFLSAKKSAVLFEPDSLAISKSGTIGRIGILKDYMCGNRAVINIKVNENICNPLFIFYTLLNSKEQIETLAEGSVQKNLYVSALSKVKLLLPDINKQKEIGYILNTLDQKIELNTQINQTLEQIAQALFKSWFVDFDPVRAKVQALSDGLSLEQAELAAMQTISGKTAEELTALSQAQPDRYAELAETAKAFPCEMVDVDGVDVPKGWEVKPLPEIIDFLEGPGIRNWQYTEEEDGIKFINIRCIQNGDLTLTTANKITKEEVFGKYKHFQLEEDDIVVSTSGTLGRFAFVRKEHLPLSLNTSVIRFRPIKNKSSLGFIAGFVENQLQHELEIRASGSAQRNFGPTHLKQISLLVPDFKLLELHQKYASSLFEKRKQLLSEIDTLKDTRDLLLPRLLKGEI